MVDVVTEAHPPFVGAAVDAGSNSVHILVAAVRGHDLEPLVDESVFLNLADRVDAAGFLGREARATLADALARYSALARDGGAASIVFLATEPLRRAADAARAVAEVEAATSIGLHVVSHEEEAYLTLIGVTAGRPLLGELAVVDIGGGSTEVVHARPDAPVSVEAIAIGSARLTAAIVEHDPPTPGEVEALRIEAAAHVAALPPLAARDIVAVGGTASNLLKVLPTFPSDMTLTRERLAEAVGALVVAPASEVASRHGINAARARILPAGAALLEAILDRAAADRIRVSEAGLREGTVLVTAHAGIAWRDRLTELVRGWDD